MTGDPLDRIEEDAHHVLTPGRANWGWEASLARDVLALVDIARAARALRDARQIAQTPVTEERELDAALARLDGPR